MVVLCQLKELKLSCFGCCGNHYAKKKDVMRDVYWNNKDFKQKKSLKQFITRTNELRYSGICANLIKKDGQFLCPGHAAANGGRDVRNLDPDCQKDFICKTFGLFQKWSKKRQEQFLEFLKNKKLTSYAYSVKMDSGSLLEEFREKIQK